jgi:hypothetical protein
VRISSSAFLYEEQVELSVSRSLQSRGGQVIYTLEADISRQCANAGFRWPATASLSQRWDNVGPMYFFELCYLGMVITIDSQLPYNKNPRRISLFLKE